jgi:hypothetical protein
VIDHRQNHGGNHHAQEIEEQRRHIAQCVFDNYKGRAPDGRGDDQQQRGTAGMLRDGVLLLYRVTTFAKYVG